MKHVYIAKLFVFVTEISICRCSLRCNVNHTIGRNLSVSFIFEFIDIESSNYKSQQHKYSPVHSPHPPNSPWPHSSPKKLWLIFVHIDTLTSDTWHIYRLLMLSHILRVLCKLLCSYKQLLFSSKPFV